MSSDDDWQDDPNPEAAHGALPKQGLDKDAEARWDAAQEGAELLREGEVEAAIAELERVVTDDPDNEHALYFLGAAHFERGRFDKAAKAYVEALRVAPQFSGALVGLGHAMRMQGRPTEALKIGRELLDRDEKDSDGLYLVGLSHYARGEAAAAERFLLRFLDSQPEAEVANEARGLIHVLNERKNPSSNDLN